MVVVCDTYTHQLCEHAGYHIDQLIGMDAKRESREALQSAQPDDYDYDNEDDDR